MAARHGPCSYIFETCSVSVQFHTVDGEDVCRVQVRPPAVPVEAIVTAEKDGQPVKKTVSYVRTGNSTRSLNADEQAKYILSRWPATSTA